jgi:hypothetical protein
MARQKDPVKFNSPSLFARGFARAGGTLRAPIVRDIVFADRNLFFHSF